MSKRAPIIVPKKVATFLENYLASREKAGVDRQEALASVLMAGIDARAFDDQLEDLNNDRLPLEVESLLEDTLVTNLHDLDEMLDLTPTEDLMTVAGDLGSSAGNGEPSDGGGEGED